MRMGPQSPTGIGGRGHLLTVRQVSEQLNVSRSLVYAEIDRGRLPARRIGTCWRVYSGDLHEYLHACQSETEQAGHD